jgi:PPK2 family polyphosphate:nucleotide phosphotransferase
MKIRSKDFRVRQQKTVNLKKWPTRGNPYYTSKADYKRLLGERTEQLKSLQERLYASSRYAMLIIFQGMDAAGKDSAIEHVMSGVNPQGCQVFSFKPPNEEELRHDFLWRTVRRLPARGWIGIFNRSYYEEVLVVRVHREILHNQGLPQESIDEKTIWEERYRSILDFERHLHRNGTRVVKFFLHISKEEQRQRLIARIDDPKKHWKFNRGDLAERKLWKDYRKAYEDCLSATSTKHAPWYVIPADDKANARLIISEIILDTLDRLGLAYPELSDELKNELRALRQQLHETK